MKKNSKLLLFLAIVFFISFSVWQVRIKNSESKIQGEKTVQENTSLLKINDGKNLQSFDVSEFIGKTALEATESKARVATNGTGVNAFVISIDGIEANTNRREFWEFIVNGSQAQVGAGSYIIQNNDEIQWKITNF